VATQSAPRLAPGSIRETLILAAGRGVDTQLEELGITLAELVSAPPRLPARGAEAGRLRLSDILRAASRVDQAVSAERSRIASLPAGARRGERLQFLVP
jgi:hypothetical protein